MECLWSLFSHWQPDGDRNQQDPPVFYLCFHTDDGITSYYLPRTGILEEYEELYLGGEEESLVLSLTGFLNTNNQYSIINMSIFKWESHLNIS